ncbi:hypothetical protein [Streptomyces sp. Root369]|uniref:hypothetical protein n=1 Tax=Streptomyces sp. Root369 TaxID=1736523 RepID=UPI00070E8025|nr:hypothetical protein [Streptomyces sp. Root369]KQW13586.1 hypothetical protein ASD08_30960 [Streptomyces sp. Root369]
MALKPAKKSRQRKPQRPELPPTGLLDWSNPVKHWKRVALPCRYQCGGWPTHLRDSSGSPAHKVCAELAIAQQIREYAEAYENERLHLT